MLTKLTGWGAYSRENSQDGWLNNMATDRFIMPLQAYISGLHLLEGNQEHLEYIIREHTENISPMAIRDLCYALVAMDQYKNYMIDEISAAKVDLDNNIRLTQENAVMIQMYQESMNDCLDILCREHNIVLEEQ